MKCHRFFLFLIITGIAALLPERALAQPLILAEPTTKSAFVGDGNVTVQILATGSPAPTYQWQQEVGNTSFSNISNNGTFAGVTTAALTINFTDTTLNGNKYQCVVTSGSSVTSVAAKLHVYTPTITPPTVTITGTGVDGGGNATIAANSTANITIQITGLNPGDTVGIQRSLDLNGNGKADPGEPIAQSFVVTDGQTAQFGGITDPDIPGDDDGVADGNITTHITLPSSPEVGRNAGTFLIKVGSPTGEFKTVTKTLIVTQPTYGQTVSGQVKSGGTGVPFAPVIFLMSEGQNQMYVAGMVSDSNGNYTMQLPTGSTFTVISTAQGYVQPFSTANQVTLSSKVNQTGVNVGITPATCTITSPGNDSAGSPLHGAQYFIQSKSAFTDGAVAIAFTDSDSNLIAALTSASDWDFQLSQYSAHLLGYLQPQNDLMESTTGGNLTIGTIKLTAGNALIYGVVQDNENNRLGGVNVEDGDNNYQDNATTYGNGSYYLLANGPASGTPDNWNVNLSDDSPGLQNYLSPQGVNLNVFSAQAYPNNIVLQSNAASLQGTVKENGTPVTGIQLDLFYNGQFETAAFTDNSGNFSFGVATGNWSLALDTVNNVSYNVVGPDLSENVTGNQSITGIVFPVIATTGTISGNVQNGNSSGSVSATATVGGVVYSSGANLDGSGDYSFPVFNGVWTVSVSGNNGSTYTSQNVTVNGSASANFTAVNTAPPLGSPLVLAGATNKSAFVGDANVTFQVLATSNISLTYQWQSKTGNNSFANLADNSTIVGSATANLTVNKPALDMNGTILRCLVTNSIGTVKSLSGNLYVYNTPTVTPNLVVTPSTLAANDTGNIGINVTGLNSGDSVRVQVFQDSNGNGIIDPGEPLVESFVVSDGNVTQIGGITDPDIPGDDDGVADGNITTHFHAPPGGFTSGNYIVKVVSPSGEFKGVTQEITITQPIYGQTIRGQVTSSSTPVPYANIILLSSFGDNYNFAGGMVTDANGNYTLQAPPGSYVVYAAAPGYVLAQTDAASANVTSGNLTGVNINLTAATCTISTTVEDEFGPTLPGLQYFIQSNNAGEFGLAYTDTSGNLITAVTEASDWDLQVTAADAHLHGYLEPQSDPIFDTTSGDLKSTPIQLTEANALITGQVEDTLGNSLPGISVDDNDNNNLQDQAITDGNGNFYLLANGPVCSEADPWSVSVDSNNPTLAGYALPDSQGVDVLSGQNNSINFTVQPPPTPLGYPFVLAGATSQTAFVGDATATFQVLAASDSSLTYQWQTEANGVVSNVTNNTTFAGATTATLTINNPTLVLNGTGYRCIVTNSNGSVNSLGAQLNVYSAPTITPNLVVTPGSIAANSTNNISFQVTDVTAGDTVRVEIYADANANHQVDLGEPLVQSFYVTDGQVNQFGGITDPDLIGDDDGLANGNITAHINLTNSSTGSQLAGLYIVKVSSPNGEFRALTQTLTITQPNYGQTVSGQVLNGSTPVPYAAVLLLNATSHDKELVGGAHADANGNYSLEAPVGSYIVYAIATGYVLSDAAAPNVTVTSAQDQSGVNVGLVPATCTITSQVENSDNGNPVGGIEVSYKSGNNNEFGVAYSNSDGNLIAPVTAASDWSLNVGGDGLHALGYLQPQNDLTVDTSAGSVGQASIQLAPGTALIYGTFEDNLGHPLAGVSVYADDDNGLYEDDTTTDSNGTYYLLAADSTNGQGEGWLVNPDSSNPVLANYVTPQGQNVNVFNDQSYLTNFVAEPATAHLQGTVTNNDSPVSGIQLDLFSVSDGNSTFVSSITTNSTGNFDFGVTNGNWSLALDTYNLSQENVVGPNLSENVTGNQTISGIDYEVVTATGNISGTVGNGDTGGSVSASATIGGILYNAGAQINGSGGFSFPVINGNWNVSVNSNNGQNYNTQNITVNGSAVANFTQSGGNQTYMNGTVTQNGSPVANVTVTAYKDLASGSGSLGYTDSVQTTAGSDGTFSLSVSGGNWTLDATSNDSNVILPTSISGNIDPALNFTVTDGSNISGIDIQALEPVQHITGEVLDQNNNLLPATFTLQATTTINGNQYIVNGATDDTGSYSLGVVDDTWLVSITSSGFIIPGAQTVVVNGADMVANFTIDVTAYLQGTVTDNNGNPVAGLNVGASDLTGDSVQINTANDGTFSLGVIGGNWTFDFPNGSGPNIILPVTSISYQVTDGTNITGIAIPVLAPNEQITGTVFDSYNQPIATNSTSVAAGTTINGFTYSVFSSTDDTGNYSLSVTNGTWTVYAYPLGYLLPTAQNVTVNGAAQVANFTTPATAHIIGTATENAAPVSGLSISALDANADFVFTTTASDGTFDLGVIAGDWTVNATTTDPSQILPSENVTYTVTDGTNITGVNIAVLPVTAQINGTVFNQSGQPNTDEVSITANTTVNGIAYSVFTVTDQSGNYSLAVGNGTWVVNAHDYNSGRDLTPQTVPINGLNVTANFSSTTAYLEGTATINGNPASGVVINASDENNDQVQTTSASDGTFSLGVFGGEWTLSVISNDPNLIQPSLSFNVTDGTNITDIALPLLEAGEQISGTVLFSNNQPITAAEVMANTTISGVAYSVITYTDGQGHYTLPLANGDWEVSIVTNTGLSLNPQSITLNDANQVVNFTQQVANFAQAATAYLDGTVTLDGSPVSNVTINGYDNNGDYDFTNNAANGTFSLGVVGGDWTTYFTSSNTDLIMPTSIGPFNVTDGANITNIAVPVLAATEQISGNVRDFFNGADSVGAQVVATTTINGVSYSVTGYTDGSGHYSLGVADGTWQVNVYDSGFNPPAQNATLSGAGQTVNFAVNAEAFLYGTVTLNNNPLTGVNIYGYDDQNEFDYVSSVNDGTFVLGVVDGNWSLNFSGAGPNVILPTGLGPYQVTGSANITNINVPALLASEQISGNVMGFNGQASVGARVMATTTINGFNYAVIAYTDDNGHYVLGVANGAWLVSVSDAGFNPPSQNVTVNNANEEADFTESATAYLDGTVSENGTPVSGVNIYGYDNNGDFDNTTSVSDGTFSLGVVGGDWTLYFTSSNTSLILPTSLGPDTVTDGTNITNILIPVLPANEQISGTVLDLNNQPSVGARVSANTTIDGVAYTVTTYTDSNGQYALGVTDGTWQINVTGAGFNPSPVNVVVNGANAVIVITALPPVAPGITTQPQSTAVVPGQSGNFTVVAHGEPAPSFQWQISTDSGNTWNDLTDNSTYSGSATATLEVVNATDSQAGLQFQCVVYNEAGSVTSNVAELDINFLPLTDWGQNYFSSDQLTDPDISGLDATPAGDGIPNLLKYAFNINPLENGRGQLPIASAEGGQLLLSFTAVRPDIVYTVQASTDLIHWSTDGVMLESNGNEITASYNLTGNATAFMRVVVSPAPMIPAPESGEPSAGVLGVLYDYAPTTPSGLGSNVSWSLAPGYSLPPGLSLNPDTGEITGMTNETGAYTVTLQVVDQNGDIQTVVVTLPFVPPGRGAPVVQIIPTQLSVILPANAPASFTIANVGPIGSVLNYNVADDGALSGFLSINGLNNDYVSSLGAGQSATINITIQPQFVSDDSLAGATLVADVHTPGATNFVKVPVSVNVYTEQELADNLLGEWSGTWSAVSDTADSDFPSENSTANGGTWTLDIESIDAANSTASGTLTWSGNVTYWTQYSADNGYSYTTSIQASIPLTSIYYNNGYFDPDLIDDSGVSTGQGGDFDSFDFGIQFNAVTGELAPSYTYTPEPGSEIVNSNGVGYLDATFSIPHDSDLNPSNPAYDQDLSGYADLGSGFYRPQHITGSHVSSP